MTTYIIRRLIMGLIVLILVSVLVFVAMRLLPGDPIRMLVTESESKEFTEQQIEQLKKQFGLDKPMAIQYFNWLGGIFRRDLGQSIIHHAPVAGEIS